MIDIDQILATTPHQDLVEKFRELEKSLACVDAERAKFAAERQKGQADLTKIKASIRGRGYISNYLDLTTRQAAIARRMAELSSIGASLNEKKRTLQLQRDSVRQELFRLHYEEAASVDDQKLATDTLVDGLLAIHAKYLAFAKDSTRINSMRLLAAEVASDLHGLIKRGAPTAAATESQRVGDAIRRGE